MKSVPTSPEKMTPFRIGGWRVDALSQGTMRLLRKIADQDGWPVEQVIITAMEEFVVGHKAEKELEAKIIRFPTPTAIATPEIYTDTHTSSDAVASSVVNNR